MNFMQYILLQLFPLKNITLVQSNIRKILRTIVTSTIGSSVLSILSIIYSNTRGLHHLGNTQECIECIWRRQVAQTVHFKDILSFIFLAIRAMLLKNGLCPKCSTPQSLDQIQPDHNLRHVSFFRLVSPDKLYPFKIYIESRRIQSSPK